MNSQFLVIHCKSVYNYILGRPFAVALDVVASLVHLKLFFHNLHGEPITINLNLKGAKRIYQVLQQDQKEIKAMEINVA